jgi:hypothetical protein
MHFSAADDLTVNVNSGSTFNSLLGGTAMNLTGKSITLNNSGTIDPALLGLVTLLSNGVVIGNGSAGVVNVNNSATGTLNGTSGILGLNLGTLNGMALNINNGAGGSTTIVNNGSIGSSALLGLTLLSADAPVVAVRGGSQVNMTNNGTLVGRVAFQSSTAGNNFTNTGQITGGVSLGAAVPTASPR